MLAFGKHSQIVPHTNQLFPVLEPIPRQEGQARTPQQDAEAQAGARQRTDQHRPVSATLLPAERAELPFSASVLEKVRKWGLMTLRSNPGDQA